MKQILSFQTGIKDGLPVGLGYFPVAMTFGMIASKYGFHPFYPLLISLTSFTGTGQFMGIDLINQAATFIEIIITILLINIRYFLMSLSLLQRLPSSYSMKKKLLIAFGVTDENYAIMMQQTKPLTFSYIMGILVISYFGWCSGTLLGSVVTNFLPAALISAFGIALYGMFLAIIIPSAMDSKPILFIVIGAGIMSCLSAVIPIIKNLGSGWILILCGVTTSAIAAYFAPIKETEEEQDTSDDKHSISYTTKEGEVL